MKFGFVDEHRHLWTVSMICAVLGISASGYYSWRRRLESRRGVENRALLWEIRRIHAESAGCYGTPRLHAVLRAAGSASDATASRASCASAGCAA